MLIDNCILECHAYVIELNMIFSSMENDCCGLNVFAFSGTKSFQLQDVFSLENEDSDDTTTLIDNKVSR